jgi:hypothetical protein
VRNLLISAALIAFFSIAGAARAQELSESDRDFLFALLPASQEVLLSPEQLISSSSDISSAAGRMLKENSCSMDKELIGFGAALQNASTALKWLEPMLLKLMPLRPGVLVNPSPAEAQALQVNFQRRQAFRGALDKVAQAGGMLSTLDPIGSAGPPAKAGPLIRDAGQMLMDLNEQSGIGIYLNVSGSSIEAFRLANLRLDKKACMQTARLVGQMAGLTGASLSFSRGILWQSESAKALSVALFEMSQQMPMPSLDQLDGALELYAKGLMQQARALRMQSNIALTLDAPEEFADSAAKFRNAAPIIAGNATRYDPIIARISEARSALVSAPAASGTGIATAMRSAGTTLNNYGVWYALIATGEALVHAGELMSAGKAPAAAQTLSETAQKVILAEKPLALEKL